MSNEEKKVKPAESKVTKSKKSPKKKATKSIKKTVDVESNIQHEAEIISSVISEESVSEKEVKFYKNKVKKIKSETKIFNP